MKKVFGRLLVILAVAVFLVFITSSLWLPPRGYTHEGKGLFTQEQYQDFKGAMASQDVKVCSIDILDGNYPLLISYEFTSLDETSIYGEDVSANPNGNFIFFSILCVVPLVSGMKLLKPD